MAGKRSSREIIVTGAHRSGSSAVATFLANLGIEVGDPKMLLGAAKDNEKGFFERQDVMCINDDILACANSSWHQFDLTALNDRCITDEIQQNIATVLNSLRKDDCSFLLKDPRFSLTLPVWLEYFQNPLVIVCLRNPLEVSRSLQRRNGFSIYKSLAIWETYLWYLHTYDFQQNYLYVDFNSFLRDPEQYGKSICDELLRRGVAPTFPVENAIHKSFDSRLRHEECEESELESVLSVRQMDLWRSVRLKNTVTDLLSRYPLFNVSEALRQKNTDIGYSQFLMQLFWDTGKGFREEESARNYIDKNTSYVFNVTGDKFDVFRLDPLNIPCIVNRLKIDCIFSDGCIETVELIRHNGHFDPESNIYYFPHGDSSVFFRAPRQGVVQIRIDIAYSSLDETIISKQLVEYLQQKVAIAEKESFQVAAEKIKIDTLPQKILEQLNDSFLQRMFSYARSSFLFAQLLKEPSNLKGSLRFLWLFRQEKALFSSNYYVEQNEDIDPLKVSPLVHFLVCGWKERRAPSQFFNIDYYLSVYKDVAKQGINPLLHYIEKGWLEGRNPSNEFITNTYIACNPSILAGNTNLILHRSAQPHNTLAEKTTNGRILFGTEPKKLIKAVAVIIPIYLASNRAAEVLECLIKTIVTSYPKVDSKLSFVLINDGSPMEGSKALISKTGILNRDDVTYVENAVNEGFVKTVNIGLEYAHNDADVVLLNSDTEIHGAVFEILQHACYRAPKIASVTPLSNRATIASLTNWPFGDDSIYDLSPSNISLVVEGLALVGGQNHTPSGHGFCMYLSRKALNDVGGFDAVTFLQGYGEENDWSMRAIAAGYEHTICTECFVFHHESMSFSQEAKEKLKQENSKKLLEKYPYYNEMVFKHLSDNHLDRYRKIIRLMLLGKKKEKSNLKSFCFVIHDSFKNYKGGVQQHVRQLIDGLLMSCCDYELFVVSPDKLCGTNYEIYFANKNERIDIPNLDKDALLHVMDCLEKRLDVLHIHHTFCIEPEVVDWLKRSKVPRKVFTIHDYDLFCSNPFLLDDRGEFCLATDDSGYCSDKVCNVKLKNASILTVVDKIIVPSKSCRDYTTKLLGTSDITQKIEILPHFLTFIEFMDQVDFYGNIGNRTSKNVIFLGALYPHKGGDCFLECTEKMLSMGFVPSIWGHAQPNVLSAYATPPPVLAYRNWRELLDLHKSYGVHIAVMPACCPETYSYTLYEALLLLGIPVIVGPYGNPAEVVAANGVGVVLADNSDSSLLEAITTITQKYDDYLDAIKNYAKCVYQSFARSEYLKKYVGIVLAGQIEFSPQFDVDRLGNTQALIPPAQNIMSHTLSNSLQDPIRVLIVHALSKADPPYFYRVENPYHYLKIMGCYVDVVAIEDIPTTSSRYDLIYLSRTPLTKKLKALLQDASAKKVTSVLDVDDLIFHPDFLKHFYFLEPSSASFDEYEKLLESIERTFGRVDILLGSTPTIASVAQQYGKTSLYYRNTLRDNQRHLYEKLYDEKPSFKEKLIGYFSGSNTHNRDFEMILPVLDKLFCENADVRLLVMGFVGKADFFQKFSDRILFQEFDTYEKYLQSLQQCKVVIVPISEINDFSNAKSSIKYLEAGAVGTPVISSPINEMVYSIEHGVTGWLARDEEEWLTSLSCALTEDYAERVGETAHGNVMEKQKNIKASFFMLIQNMSQYTCC